MIDIVEVLEHWYAGRPKAVVAESLGLDRKTIPKYVAPAEEMTSPRAGAPRSERPARRASWRPARSGSRIIAGSSRTISRRGPRMWTNHWPELRLQVRYTSVGELFMTYDTWSTADTRERIEVAAGLTYRCLMGIASELVSQSELNSKFMLANELRSIAGCLDVLAVRYRDVRGDVSMLPARAFSRVDADAYSIVELLSKLAALTSGGPWRTDNRLALEDWDSAKAYEFVAGVAHRSLEALCIQQWARIVARDKPPRRPGRPKNMVIVDSVTSPPGDEDMTASLHGVMFSIELCAAELCAEMIALDAGSAPVGCVVDLAKQVQDEMRHFKMLENLLLLRRAKVGDYPIDTLIWDKFLLATKLTERLVVEQRLGEGVGLDGGLGLYEEFGRRQDEVAKRCMDFINADEMTHVRNGNKWILTQLGSWEAVRDLDLALRDRLAAAGWPVKHWEPINVDDRALAGFSVDEILEIRKMAQS